MLVAVDSSPSMTAFAMRKAFSVRLVPAGKKENVGLEYLACPATNGKTFSKSW